jgi:hypothetical protein
MGFRKFLGGLVKVFKSEPMKTLGPVIVEAYVPGIIPLIEFAVDSVASAEDELGPGTGPQKLENVMNRMAIGTPLVVRLIENATGKELVDEAGLQKGLKGLAVSMVDIMNSFRLLPKG